MSDDCNQTSLVDSVTQTSEEFTPLGEHIFHDDMRASNLLTGFSKLYKNQEFVDVVLCVGSTEFPCHRNVLAISSPYFMAMFSGGLAESQQVCLSFILSVSVSLCLSQQATPSKSCPTESRKRLSPATPTAAVELEVASHTVVAPEEVVDVVLDLHPQQLLVVVAVQALLPVLLVLKQALALQHGGQKKPEHASATDLLQEARNNIQRSPLITTTAITRTL